MELKKLFKNKLFWLYLAQALTFLLMVYSSWYSVVEMRKPGDLGDIFRGFFLLMMLSSVFVLLLVPSLFIFILSPKRSSRIISMTAIALGILLVCAPIIDDRFGNDFVWHPKIGTDVPCENFCYSYCVEEHDYRQGYVEDIRRTGSGEQIGCNCICKKLPFF